MRVVGEPAVAIFAEIRRGAPVVGVARQSIDRRHR
jgi:hypothetical protein